MTSKKLSSKRIFAVCKTQLYQMRLLFVLFGLGLVILPTLITWGSFANYAHYGYDYEYNSLGVKSVLSGAVMICGFALMFGLALAMAVMQFGYLHKRQKLDYFHAIPVLRAEHFLGRVLATFTVLILSSVLIALGQFFSLGVTLGFNGDGLAKFIFWRCFWIIWPSFSAYFFAVLMIVLTATLWETIFSLLAVTALSPAVVMCAYVLVINSMPINDAVLDWALIAAFSPLIHSIYFVAELALVQNYLLLTGVILICLIHLLLCGSLAMWFFCRRRSELAESNTATRFKMFVRFAAAFCAAALGSVVMLFVTEKYFAYWIGAVLGIAIAWLIMELLYTRSLKKVVKSLGVNLLGLALFAVINMLVLFGVIGLPDIPKAEDVYAVSVKYGKETVITSGELAGSASYESFNGDSQVVYTDENRHYVSMGASGKSEIEAGVALAQAMLENQKALYFPYKPNAWGGYNRSGVTYTLEDSTDELISYDVTVELYVDGKVRRFSYGDMEGSGRIDELFDRTTAIAESEEYRKSCPTLAVLENLNRVEFVNYEVSADTEVYTLPDTEETQILVERLQEAYAQDLYTYNKGSEYSYDVEKYGAATEPIPVTMQGEYTLFVDPSKEIVFDGGILDGTGVAKGLHGWPSPEFTEYKVEENYWTTSTAIHLDYWGYPRTCSVLDEMRAEQTTK